MTAIPAVSVRQPWAELIMRGRKTVEVRSWSTPHRGSILVHTGARGDAVAERRFDLGTLFKGGFVGIVQLGAVLRLDPDRWAEWRALHLDPGPFRPGLYGWLLDSPRRFMEPLPAAGQLGLFRPAPDLEWRLQQLVGEAARSGPEPADQNHA